MTFLDGTGYTAVAMDEPITHEQLTHVLRTMLQVIDNAYYRSGFLTTEHGVFEVVKRALESGIRALERTDTEAVVAIASDGQNKQ